jgi:hypothetical protein
MKPHCPFKVNRRFGGTSSINLQGRRTNKDRNQHETGSKHSRHVGFFIGFYFDPED